MTTPTPLPTLMWKANTAALVFQTDQGWTYQTFLVGPTTTIFGEWQGQLDFHPQPGASYPSQSAALEGAVADLDERVRRYH